MMEDWLIPFQYQYMIKAIVLSALVGGVCAFLSCFITLKGWALMGDALSHAIVPGVAVASLLGWPFSVGAFIAGVLASTSMGWIKNHSRLKEDAVIGLIFTTWFAFGLFLISVFPSPIHLKSIIFGNILGISDGDVVQVVLIGGVCLLFLLLKWRDLLLYCFDPTQARSLGLNVSFLHFSLLALLSATAVAALQTVGAILVVAMLITPGATAYLLTDRFGKMIAIAVAIGVLCSALGAYLSYFFDGSTGGCIVVLQTLVFLAAFFFAPKHGLRAQRRFRKLPPAHEEVNAR